MQSSIRIGNAATLFTKLKAINNKTADEVQNAFRLTWCHDFGWPGNIRCNNGGEFNLIQSLAQQSQTQVQRTASYSPQSNGLCEGRNWTAIEMITTVLHGAPMIIPTKQVITILLEHHVQHCINNLPSRQLDWTSPAQAA